MHSAPSVSYPVRPSRSVQRLLLVVWCAGIACAALAAWQMHDVGWRAGLQALSVLLSALALRHGATGLRSAEGVLRFDGAGWSVPGDRRGFSGRAEVCLDLQTLLLLRLIVPGQSVSWLWLERGADPARWQDLRRAVYSRAPTSRSGVGPTDASAAGAPLSSP